MHGRANVVGLDPRNLAWLLQRLSLAVSPEAHFFPAPAALHTQPPGQPSSRTPPCPVSPLWCPVPSASPDPCLQSLPLSESQRHLHSTSWGPLPSSPLLTPIGAATLSSFPDTDAETKWGDRASRPGPPSDHRSARRASNHTPRIMLRPACRSRPPQDTADGGLASIHTGWLPSTPPSSQRWRSPRGPGRQSSAGTAEECSGRRKASGSASPAF